MSHGKSFRWADYISLADELIDENSAPGEAKYRTAISRAYYGAFCSARNMAIDNRWVQVTRTGRDHRLVREYYEDDSDLRKRYVGTFLLKLRVLRNQADYDDYLGDIAKTAETAVGQAMDVLDKLRQIGSKENKGLDEL